MISIIYKELQKLNIKRNTPKLLINKGTNDKNTPFSKEEIQMTNTTFYVFVIPSRQEMQIQLLWNDSYANQSAVVRTSKSKCGEDVEEEPLFSAGESSN